MKISLPLFFFAIACSAAGLLNAQQPSSVPPTTSTKPAKASEVAPASDPKPSETKPPAAKLPETKLPEVKSVEVKSVEAKSPEAKSPDASTSPSANDTRPDQDINDSILPKDRRSPYIIGPEDQLMIKVWQEGNLSGPVTVGPDGMISLQLIDEVKADGLTPEQLKGVLTTRLKAFIVNPDVNVQVLRVVSRRFLLQGEVNRPGAYPLTGPTTFMEALVFGGGFREFANNKKVYLLRTEINSTTKKPETKRFNFNYREVSHGKRMEQNILIHNGDQIFVP